MFGRVEVWLKNNFYLHGWRKNIHESLSKQAHFLEYYIGDIYTIHTKAEQLC